MKWFLLCALAVGCVGPDRTCTDHVEQFAGDWSQTVELDECGVVQRGEWFDVGDIGCVHVRGRLASNESCDVLESFRCPNGYEATLVAGYDYDFVHVRGDSCLTIVTNLPKE